MTAAFHMVGARPRGILLPGNDPLFDKVHLLWHFEGPNGANSPIYDHSNYRWGHTNAGGVSFNTGTPKFGLSSGLWDGGDHIRVAGGTVPNIPPFGTDDFTIEMWINHRAIGGTDYIFETRNASGDTNRPAIRLNATKLEYFVSSAARIISSYVPVINTWYHLAVCRVAGQTRMFVNGVQTGATYADANNYTIDVERPLFGADFGANNFFDGFMDEIRITHAGRYPANFTVPAAAFPNYGEKLTLGQALPYLGLETSLRFTLDAAMAGSYKVGNNRWYDVANLLGSTRSGGINFYVGLDATIGSATDPTFNGVENGGSANEYFSFDGGDYFHYDSTNWQFMNELSEDGATWSVFTWIYLPAIPTGGQSIFGTNAGILTDEGVGLFFTTGGNLVAQFSNATGTAALQTNSGTIPLQVGWNAIGYSINEAANRMTFFCNGTTKAFAATFVSPGTTDPASRFQIGARGNAHSPMGAGSRMASFAMWQPLELTQANFEEIFKYTRSVYGL